MHCTIKVLISQWHKAVDLFSRSILPVKLDESGHDAPPGIVPMLDRLIASLTHVDYRKRLTDVNVIIRLVDSALRIMDNLALENKHRERKRFYRQKKQDKFLHRMERQAQLALERSQDDA